ncbi:cupin domain-containing protein [Desulfurobacterium atlanticum]|uniref:Cupin domain-containing protein n=1 Tax=Desulfurobacterium atlanticum TaxID=240169 RepID=A0A238YIU5_9BACT|nr:cupin domain-containing protein [Desulfurobacterium atlanticum]SNR70533.1 Cupin domain-containing protein [Desulfurobacterium atlanticum]
MKIIKSESVSPFDNPHKVKAQKLLERDDISVNLITLEKGEGLKLHKTPVDVLFFILSGEGIVEIGEEKEKVKEGDLIESPANIPHRLENTGDKTFKFLVLKLKTAGGKDA